MKLLRIEKEKTVVVESKGIIIKILSMHYAKMGDTLILRLVPHYASEKESYARK